MRELTIDEAALALGLGVSDIFRLRFNGKLLESSKNRFSELDISAAKDRKFRKSSPRPIEISATDLVDSYEYTCLGVRGGLTMIDERARTVTVNTLSDREARTQRERIADELKLSAA